MTSSRHKTFTCNCAFIMIYQGASLQHRNQNSNQFCSFQLVWLNRGNVFINTKNKKHLVFIVIFEMWLMQSQVTMISRFCKSAFKFPFICTTKQTLIIVCRPDFHIFNIMEFSLLSIRLIPLCYHNAIQSVFRLFD